MKIGDVIRSYRKNKNLTQEEMARRLGVTAPAVNKWENNVSLPDITLLAPIARLLETTPDTLLSFREELSQEEINAVVQEADAKFQIPNKPGSMTERFWNGMSRPFKAKIQKQKRGLRILFSAIISAGRIMRRQKNIWNIFQGQIR